MKLSQHICDNCKKPLDGIFKGEEIKRDYMMFKGQFGIEIWNEEFKTYEWFWLTKALHHEVTFCDLKCLEEFIAKKRQDHDEWMQVRIRSGEDPYNQARR